MTFKRVDTIKHNPQLGKRWKAIKRDFDSQWKLCDIPPPRLPITPQFRTKVKKAIDASGLPQIELARLIGVYPAMIHHFYRGKFRTITKANHTKLNILAWAVNQEKKGRGGDGQD